MRLLSICASRVRLAWVAKVSIGERRGWPGDDDRVVT